MEIPRKILPSASARIAGDGIGMGEGRSGKTCVNKGAIRNIREPDTRQSGIY
jgi:hypothetical protein